MMTDAVIDTDTMVARLTARLTAGPIARPPAKPTATLIASEVSPVRRFLMVSAIIRRSDEILLVKNNWGIGPVWTIPGGRLEEGEAAGDAVRREVREETGLEVELGDLAYLLDYHNTTIPAHFLTMVFPARVVRGELTVPAADEFVIDVRWVKVAELDRYLHWPAYREPLLAYLAGQSPRYYRNPDAGWKGPLPAAP